jgi:hypothetical protein
LIEDEGKLLRGTRHQATTNDVNPINKNSILSNPQSPLVTSQHLTQIPKQSILDHQQVCDDSFTENFKIFFFSFLHYGTGYQYVLVSLNLF